ncbi:hypothetical protein LOZ59_003277 [Ophidiomyces ophidiicola]|nr:hypothetical protein LOZ59_003277 [Ophidiomyces ophidiicola]KAI2147164.1 hypothetical protein LOZ27_002772 [Ophidiomyces ophidiicola]KAI2235578.1 hypothetical protein LOZ13_004889 [Ophidiomyces ophidiicola]KAI2412788.1 hypothetical protein LOY90_001843 [Ophidiomyces ophidiicola]
MAAANKGLIYRSAPEEFPVPGTDLVIEDVPFDTEAPAPDGGLIAQSLYTSFDPYMRGAMRPPHIKSYRPPYDIGQPIPSLSILKVLKSKNDNFKVGDIVTGFTPIQQYITISAQAAKGLTLLENPLGISDLRLFLGALGMPGLTAYSSLLEIGKPKKGETIFISSAAGAVGQVVGQIAKHEGLRVIGSVGSDEKLDYIIKDLGFDGGFNYKKEKASDALKRLAPNGIDIYYENVGGEQLQAAIEAMNDFGRIVACGMISQYNVKPENRYPITNLFMTVSKRLTIRGFIVSDPGMGDKWAKEHRERVSQWIKDGTFKPMIHETVGIDNAAKGLVGLFKGENFGKAVLKLSEEAVPNSSWRTNQPKRSNPSLKATPTILSTTVSTRSTQRRPQDGLLPSSFGASAETVMLYAFEFGTTDGILLHEVAARRPYDSEADAVTEEIRLDEGCSVPCDKQTGDSTSGTTLNETLKEIVGSGGQSLTQCLVNDAVEVPHTSPTHGSYHWDFERYLERDKTPLFQHRTNSTYDRIVAASLVPLTLAPFAAGSLNPVTDAILCGALVLHSHIGFQALIVDYLPQRRVPKTRAFCIWTLRLATLTVAVGLYEFETNDVGVTEAIKRIWKA